MLLKRSNLAAMPMLTHGDAPLFARLLRSLARCTCEADYANVVTAFQNYPFLLMFLQQAKHALLDDHRQLAGQLVARCGPVANKPHYVVELLAQAKIWIDDVKQKQNVFVATPIANWPTGLYAADGPMVRRLDYIASEELDEVAREMQSGAVVLNGGNTILLCHSDWAEMVDLTTMKQLSQRKFNIRDEGYHYHSKCSPDGRFVLLWEPCEHYIFEYATGKEILFCSTPPGEEVEEVDDVAWDDRTGCFSPDSKYFAYVSLQDMTVRVLCLANGLIKPLFVVAHEEELDNEDVHLFMGWTGDQILLAYTISFPDAPPISRFLIIQQNGNVQKDFMLPKYCGGVCCDPYQGGCFLAAFGNNDKIQVFAFDGLDTEGKCICQYEITSRCSHFDMRWHKSNDATQRGYFKLDAHGDIYRGLDFQRVGYLEGLLLGDSPRGLWISPDERQCDLALKAISDPMDEQGQHYRQSVMPGGLQVAKAFSGCVEDGYTLINIQAAHLVAGNGNQKHFNMKLPVGTRDCGVAFSPDEKMVAIGLRVFDATDDEHTLLFQADISDDDDDDVHNRRCFWAPEWTSSNSLIVKESRGERILITREDGEWKSSILVPRNTRLEKRNAALVSSQSVFSPSGRFIVDPVEANMLLNHTDGAFPCPHFESGMVLREILQRENLGSASNILHKILEYAGLNRFWQPLDQSGRVNLIAPPYKVVGLTLDDEFTDEYEAGFTWTPRGTLVVKAPSRKDGVAIWEGEGGWTGAFEVEEGVRQG